MAEDITHVGIRGHWIRPEEKPGENCLEVQVDEYIVQDDEEHFNQAEFLKKVAECPNCPKSSCPSPEIYRDAYDLSLIHI